MYLPLDSNVVEAIAKEICKLAFFFMVTAFIYWVGEQLGVFPITHPNCPLCL